VVESKEVVNLLCSGPYERFAMIAGFAITFLKNSIYIFLVYFPKTHGKRGREVPSPRIH